MSSGLTATKCPSCKIIVLRPLHQQQSSSVKLKSSSFIQLLHCPACRNQYSLRNGIILPTIVLTSTSLPSEELAGDSTENSAVGQKSQEKYTSPMGIRSPPREVEISLQSGAQCSCRKSPVHLLPSPQHLPNQNYAFNGKEAPFNRFSPSHERRSLNTTLAARSKQRFIHHQRSGSLQSARHTAKDLGASRVDLREKIFRSNERLDLKDEQYYSDFDERDHHFNRRRFKKVKKFLSGSSLWSKTSLSQPECPVDKGALELPPVDHMKKLSLSDNSLASYIETKSIRKPRLTSIEMLKRENVAAKESDDYTHLQEMYVNTFSSWEDIAGTFKLKKLTGSDPSDVHAKFGIDMQFVHATYSALMRLPRGIQRAVMRSVITGILKESKCHTYRHNEVKKDYLRAHLILIQNPQFDAPSAAYIVFAQLLKHLSQISTEAKKCVIHWLGTEYEPEWMRNLVAKIQQFISVRQFSSGRSDLPSNSKTSWWLSSAVQVLDMLNEACQLKEPPLLPHTEFYNSSLDHIDLMVEFYAWKCPSPKKFSYCQYPFILSLSAKKHILQQESEQQMLMMAKKSLAESVQQNEAPDTKNIFLNLNVRRLHLIEDSINELMHKKRDLKKKVRVTFTGEPGVDMGGLTKEWFLLLIKKIFQPEYGLFTFHDGSKFCWFSSGLLGEHRYYEYHLVGLLMGLAVYNSTILDLNFPPFCFKKLLVLPDMAGSADEMTAFDSTGELSSESVLTRPPMGIVKSSLKDLATVMPTIARGLKQIQECDSNVEDLCYSFQVSQDALGSATSTELIPNGRNIPVTDENKTEFIDLYVDYLLNKSISQQFTAFYYGFHSICDATALKLLQPGEVESLICGCPEFDMKALQSVTTYDGYEKTDDVIKGFWEVLESLTILEQQRLMVFVTGSCRVPVGGMACITFKISKLPFPSPNKYNILPMAHTCFNQLLLPPYQSKKTLREKLTIAISNSEGFGLI